MNPSAHPFAPGAIERHPSPRRKTARRWIQRAAICAAIAIAVGLAAGVFTGA